MSSSSRFPASVACRILAISALSSLLFVAGCGFVRNTVSQIAPSSKLAFTVQPSNVAAGGSITQPVTVSIEDAQGNVVTTAADSVSMAIGANPSGGTLGGTSTVAAVNGVATFPNLSINNAGAGYTLTARATSLTGATSSAFNVIVSVGPPAKLAFIQQPSNMIAGNSISPAVQVGVEDAQGNLVTAATNQISMALGTNPSNGTLGGATQVSAVAGVATFSNLSINDAGNGYTLAASAPGTNLTGAATSAFNVTPGAATKLAFTQQASNVVAGSSITPSVTVSIDDALGNLVTTANNTVSMAIGTNPSNGTLSGTLQVSAVAGVATFSNLSINNAGTGYTLMAGATNLTAATSGTYDVAAGAAAKLVFAQQPSSVVAGSSITPSVTVSVEDVLGNLVATANNTVNVAIGTNPSGRTLSGTIQVTAVAGVATFSNLSINIAGTGYTLTTSATNLTGPSSSAFNVTAGTATKLAFTQQPINAVARSPFTPAVTVSIEDALGNVVTTANTSVSMAISVGDFSTEAQLTGTTLVSAVAGVATFSNLSVNCCGGPATGPPGYGLTASAPGTTLTSADSNDFNVVASIGPPSKLAFWVQPSNVAAGSSITGSGDFAHFDTTPAVTVSITDVDGSVVTTANNTVSMAIGTNPSNGTLSGTMQATAVAGLATFSNLSIDKVGNGYTLTASETNLSGATSSAINVVVPATCDSAPTGHESVLSGRWVAMSEGWQKTFPATSVFSFSASGTGSFDEVSPGSGITGNIDENNGGDFSNSVASGNLLTGGSSYKVGLDPINRTGYLGCMILANSYGPPVAVRFALSVTAGSATHGSIIRWTDSSGNGSGIRASGVMLPQDATAFISGNTANLHSNYAFGESGWSAFGNHFAIAGTFSLDTVTGVSSATYDSDFVGTVSANQSETLTITGLDATTGRGVETGTPPGSTTPIHIAVYVVNANELFLIGIDPYIEPFNPASQSGTIFTGRAIVTGMSFNNAMLSGNYVVQTFGRGSANSSCNGTTNCAQMGLGVLSLTGTGTINPASQIGHYIQSVSGIQIENPSGTYLVAPSGRVPLTYGTNPPVLYLATPQSNTEPFVAFIVGTDYTAIAGQMEAGLNSKVSVTALAGTHIFGSVDPGDSAVNNQVGVASVDNSGNFTGYQYLCDLTTGLSEGSAINGGSPVLNISNIPLPGFGDVGPGTFAVTDGTRVWFIDTAGGPASIKVLLP